MAVLLSSLVAVVLLSLYGITLAGNLMQVRTTLLQGRDDLAAAYRTAEQAEFTRADRYFKRAKGKFIASTRTLHVPSVKILSVVPVVNRNLRALEKLTSTGLEVALAGESLSKASMRFPQKQSGIDFSIDDGRIDLKPFIDAQPHIAQANLHVLLAVAEFEKIPDGLLLSPVRQAKEELAVQLPKLRGLTSNAKQTLDILPDVLGAHGKRRYFLAVQNNAELRATGGLIGNYGILTVENGKVALEAFDEIHRLQRPDQRAIAAPKDFTTRYGRFKATSMWLNANMSPDFPTVGRVLVGLYRSVTGVRLDGVISVDPVGLKYLLAATGPVRIPEAEVDISADNVVDWTLIKAYGKYRQREERKEFLADVAQAVWGRIASGQIGDTSKFIDQFRLALAEKHIELFSMHEREQDIVESLGYAGALVPTSSDYVQVVMQNHGANKIDVYMHEKVAYSLRIRQDGSAVATAAVTLDNKTPAVGLPEYVTGPDPLSTKGGRSNTWVNVFVPKGAQLVATDGGAADSEVEVSSEKGKTVFSQYVRLAPGTSRTVKFVYELPYVLIFNGDLIEYTLVWQAQPVINRPEITVDIETPKGFAVSQMPEGFTRRGSKLHYSGVLAKDEGFKISLVDNR